MRYVPNLIPEKSKVLKDYFIGNIYKSKQSNPVFILLGWVFGVVILIGAISFLLHPALTILLGITGFIILPAGHNWIEKQFRFRLTLKIKSIFIIILLIGFMPLISHYKKLDGQALFQLKLKTDQENKIKAEAQRNDNVRKDSLNFYIRLSDKYKVAHRTNEALKQLVYASAFATTEADKNQILREQIQISVIKVQDLIKSGNYQAAIPELNNVIAQDNNNPNFLYERAICYSHTGKTLEAIADCKVALQLGNEDAKKLYEKLNPVRKRVAYYITRCCDGSTSNAKGRGACSHHGGVCDWNEPVYQEYRQYE